MSFILDEVKHLLKCAHCLNFGASNKVSVTGKIAPNGEAYDPNGQAIAFLCDDHKDKQPKFATQIIGKNVHDIPVEQLQDIPGPTPSSEQAVEAYNKVVEEIQQPEVEEAKDKVVKEMQEERARRTTERGKKFEEEDI